MKRIALFLGFSLITSLIATACGDDDDIQSTDMPALNAKQVDRIGRAAVATALMEAFNPDMVARDKAKNDYSADGDVAMWKAKYVGAAVANMPGKGIIGSLAVLDTLDVAGDVACGNHPLKNILDATPPVLPQFTGLAGVLADDQLYVNSKNLTCAQYLAVELAALGNANTDCGGRTPNYDTVDISLNTLVLGDPTAVTVTDGITQDAAKAADLAKFPFLKAP
jgi:hypothetical protein